MITEFPLDIRISASRMNVLKKLVDAAYTHLLHVQSQHGFQVEVNRLHHVICSQKLSSFGFLYTYWD